MEFLKVAPAKTHTIDKDGMKQYQVDLVVVLDHADYVRMAADKRLYGCHRFDDRFRHEVCGILGLNPDLHNLDGVKTSREVTAAVIRMMSRGVCAQYGLNIADFSSYTADSWCDTFLSPFDRPDGNGGLGETSEMLHNIQRKLGRSAMVSQIFQKLAELNIPETMEFSIQTSQGTWKRMKRLYQIIG